MRGVSAVYTTFYDLVGYVREAFKRESESAWRRVLHFQSVRALAIDEFDKVKTSEWIEELETAVIDRRYRDGLAGQRGTIIAMNSNVDSLPDWIESRLRDGRNRVIGNDDPDVRPMLRNEDEA